MILPVVAYGHPVLKHVAEEISPDYPDFKQLVDDMFETMYYSEGVGLAAPQINKSIRLFVIDTDSFSEKYPEGKGIKKVFVNPEIIEVSEEMWTFREGCLSLPNLNEEVVRPSKIKIRYLDENFIQHEDEYDGIVSRVIQHEYDHLDGIVYVDRISSMRKLLLKSKLRDISEGNVDVDYRMLFPVKKRRR
ncbi:MAG TPA: peptide deformylase [Bacteroidetes bacterium]|nr:peptide deformylase [Candidatus Limimorpha avicola]